ncbi:Rho termination factor N-terminal domain-containing protein [Leifsonia sp. NPDC080035]|uniref:Rho termination factor N-terminal domain-containing protein n=1 Tax=Leifsonia sp. NPDC080035 TaxID=3143936 RepID=A0AAU7GF52_9MICO
MGKRKKLEKAAEKAYARAEKAIEAAVEAAAAVDKDARKRAKKLRKRLAEQVPAAGGPARRPDGADHTADSTEPDAPIDLTPPLPTVTDDDADTAAEFAGSAATSAPHDPELDRMTVQALRDAARARGILNVSRLTKGQLIERLSD